jgi:epoxide hydrolase-like predicted phosphatase
MAIKAIIWDLGGVLIRTEDFSSRLDLAKDCGLSLNELEHLVFNSESGVKAQLGLITAEQHWKNVANALQKTEISIPDIQQRFWSGDRLDRALIGKIRQQRKEYMTALLSNAFDDLQNMIANVWNIQDAFDEIVISAEVGLMKPDRRIYSLVLDRLALRPKEALFIDDFQTNIDGARRANIKAVQFFSTAQISTAVDNFLKA